MTGLDCGDVRSTAAGSDECERGRPAVAVQWFRRDLRLHDNPSLASAASADRLLPVYVLDPAEYGPADYGGRDSFVYPKTGPHRRRFRREALADLRASLRALGSDLIVRIGDPASVIPALAAAVDAETVHAGRWEVPEETETADRVRESLAESPNRTPVDFEPGHTLYHPADLPVAVQRIDDTYTPFRKSVEDDDVPVREPIGVPALPPPPESVVDGTIDPGSIPGPDAVTEPDALTDPEAVPDPGAVPDPEAVPDLQAIQGPGGTSDPDPIGDVDEVPPDRRPADALTFRGGESAGIARLREYLWEGDHLRQYKETRNGLVGRNFASKLSPWLNEGCLSPRAVHDEVRRYESTRVANESTYWLVFELIWRDFFAFQVAKHGGRYFSRSGIRDRDDVDWAAGDDEARLLRRWAAGRTGVPFVDAGIRELRATGYLSNRARQNVASFLVNDCRVDWRKGAAFFETHLVDYDPCSNYGNWAYLAGVGNDSRDRAFDVVGQARYYDEDGAYVRRWIPEIACLPTEYVHEPWTMSRGTQAEHDVRLGADYPRPVVEMD